MLHLFGRDLGPPEAYPTNPLRASSPFQDLWAAPTIDKAMAEATPTQEEDTDPEPSEDVGAYAQNPRSLANLRPAWRPGQSGNPSGLTKDGLSTRDQPIRAQLRRDLAKRRRLRQLVSSWVDAAIAGDSAAREQILKRLDPVTEDPAAGRTILEGIKLELSPGKATLSMARSQHVTTSSEGMEVTEGSVAQAGEGTNALER